MSAEIHSLEIRIISTVESVESMMKNIHIATNVKQSFWTLNIINIATNVIESIRHQGNMDIAEKVATTYSPPMATMNIAMIALYQLQKIIFIANLAE